MSIIDSTFATRVDNVFVIRSTAGEPLVSERQGDPTLLDLTNIVLLPALVEDRERRLALNDKKLRKGRRSKSSRKAKKAAKDGKVAKAATKGKGSKGKK